MPYGEHGWAPYGLPENCWTPDSRYCAWTDENLNFQQPRDIPAHIVDVTGPSPEFIYQPKHGSAPSHVPRRVPGFGWEFTCSDCTDPQRKFIAANLPSEYEPYEGYGEARVARDGRRIYCYKNLGRGVGFDEYDLRTRSSRRLATFRTLLETTNHYFGVGGIRDIQESPDERFVAFQLGTKLQVFDRKRDKTTFVKDRVYGSTHWTSDSSRLYFFSCKRPGGCSRPEDFIYWVHAEDLK